MHKWYGELKLRTKGWALESIMDIENQELGKAKDKWSKFWEIVGLREQNIQILVELREQIVLI